METSQINANIIWCMHYPEDKSSSWLKIVLMLCLMIGIVYVVYSKFNLKEAGIWALVFFAFTGIGDIFIRLHRLLSYDEVCFMDGYLLIKKKTRILSKTKVEDINVVSVTNPFDMFQSSWKRLYYNNTLLFQYITNELSNENEQKLSNILKL